MNSVRAVEALSALAQDTRLAVFRLLVREAGEDVGTGRAGDSGDAGADKSNDRGGGDDGFRRPHDGSGLSAGYIAGHLKVPPATLSFHLTKLEHAGLIHSHRRGLNIFYHPDHAGVRALLGFLTDDCCQGRPELCGVQLPHQASGHQPAASS